MHIFKNTYILLLCFYSFYANSYICSINSLKRQGEEKYVHILSDAHFFDNTSDESLKAQMHRHYPFLKINSNVLKRVRSYIPNDINKKQITEFELILKSLTKKDLYFLFESYCLELCNWEMQLLVYGVKSSLTLFILDAINLCRSSNIGHLEIDFRYLLDINNYSFTNPKTISLFNNVFKDLPKNSNKVFKGFFNKFIKKHKAELDKIKKVKQDNYNFSEEFLFDLFDLSILDHVSKNNIKHLFINVGFAHSIIIKEFLIESSYHSAFEENDLNLKLDRSDEKIEEIINGIKIIDNKTFFEVINLIKPLSFNRFKSFIYQIN